MRGDGSQARCEWCESELVERGRFTIDYDELPERAVQPAMRELVLGEWRELYCKRCRLATYVRAEED